MTSTLLLRLLLLGVMAIGLCHSVEALDDPPPVGPLSDVEGEWLGTLIYKDYQPPHARVTLPVVMKASLLGPDVLALHYVYDDGPGKVVHSYERLSVDLTAGTLVWTGRDPSDTTRCRMTSVHAEAGSWVMVAEARKVEKDQILRVRYRLTLSSSVFEVVKEEGPENGALGFRNTYAFRRRR